MARSGAITAQDLGVQGTGPASSGSADDMTLEQSEKIFIQKVLAKHAGDVRKAAEQLGVSRSALYRRLQYFGL
jgi:transcriptional regulator with PAS, ATPase and Fis domain